MNLKAFHLLFIAAATVLAAGFGVWCLRAHEGDGAGTLLGAIGSFLAAAGLVGYGVWFARKARRL